MPRTSTVDAHAHHDDPTSGRLTFVGTATVILELGGLRILTDPSFLHQGDHAPQDAALCSASTKLAANLGLALETRG